MVKKRKPNQCYVQAESQRHEYVINYANNSTNYAMSTTGKTVMNVVKFKIESDTEGENTRVTGV